MPRNARTEVAATTAADSARDRVLAAAERCIERHGIRKTTIEDIASEAGMSRPGVYRYFSDRDDLLVALISQHSRALHDKGHRLLASKTSLAEQITEGVLYLADQGRRDHFMRYMVNLDGTDLGRRMVTTHTSATLNAEFWDPVLDDAIRAGTMPKGLARPDIHLWLRNLCLMVMRGLDEGEGDIRRYRTILRTFVAPAFSA
jgi:AcrR family transcriptional regulator